MKSVLRDRAVVALLAIFAVYFLLSCTRRDLRALTPCTVSGVVENIQVNTVDKIDLLVVIDDSGSMDVEQSSLGAGLPRLIRALTSGDLDQDSVQDFPPASDIHVAVVTTDMGTGGVFSASGSGCETQPDLGEDAIFQTTPGSNAPGTCASSFPSVLNFDGSVDDPDTFASEVECLVRRGTEGCGLEHQLEVALKAMTPSTSSLRFRGASQSSVTGHGDTLNDGFLREDALLVTLVVSDEEDCSVQTSEMNLFHPEQDNTEYPGPINLRCIDYPDALHPVERYVDGYLELKQNPDLFVFAAIVGVPTDLVADTSNINFDAILADSRMEAKPDALNPEIPATSCDVSGVGKAYPPRRIVQVAQSLEEEKGSNGIIQSICQSNYNGALDAIVEKIGSVLGGACLPRALSRNESGLVNCDVIETLPSGTSCSSLSGRALVSTKKVNGENRELCRVSQQPVLGGAAPTDAGWFYDDFTTDTDSRCGTEGQRIAYVDGASPITGTSVRLECLQPVQSDAVGIGTPCTPGGGSSSNPCSNVDLTCDSISNTCQQTCTSDADCDSGFRCSTNNYCVNPTCGQT